MCEHVKSEENRIKALLEAWADAVRRHDVPAILAHHEPDMVMFDLPPPLQCKGIEAYERTNCSSAIISPERPSTSRRSL
jgi:ketosteroid isomerase-like protein